jgi:hypothetical protein
MAEFDLDFVSLTLAMVGLFFICCAILQKKPKHILEEAFGVASGCLRDLRASVFKKNQLVLGYFCIVIAIIVNIFSASIAAARGILDELQPATLATAFILLTALLCAVLNYLSRLFSKWHFKQIVREVVAENHLPFESNVPLAIEIGHLLGLERETDDSVTSYLQKLRRFLDLPSLETPRRSSRSRIGLEFR